MIDPETREEERRNRIIKATLKTIALSGLDNVTMQNIALAANLSKGGLTHYYPSKQELFLASFKELFDEIGAECRANAEIYNTPIEKLLSFDMIFKMDHPLLKMAHPVLHNFMSVAAHDPLYNDIYHSWVESWLDLIREILAEGEATKGFSCSNIDSTARTISAVIQGIATRCFLASRTHPTEWAVSAYHEIIAKLLGLPYSQQQ